jgi:hypothetical protein
MGRHSMDYRAETDSASAPEHSIAPPGGPIDPGVPGAPDAPGPEAPSTVPVEPPPVAPEQPDDGAVPASGTWHAAGSDVL